ncbi:MAG: hypothetical protein NTZ05_01755 [Chloroflexi bacterium]|nr:hypothetical protein [Chloroflexota bacterium]
MEQDALIAAYIEQDPGHPGIGDARLVKYGTHVWAIVGYLYSVEWDSLRAATDYEVPVKAIEAALVYYQRHKDAIEDRIAANSAPAA